MPEPEWMPIKIATQNHELEDGLQEGSCLIQMQWIPLLGEPEADLQGQKKSITMHHHTRHEEDSCKEEEEGDVHIET